MVGGRRTESGEELLQLVAIHVVTVVGDADVDSCRIHLCCLPVAENFVETVGKSTNHFLLKPRATIGNSLRLIAKR